MKKLLSVIFIFSLVWNVQAHAPKKVTLSFDKETGTLTADIVHKVKDVNDHYIAEITIWVNDQEVMKTDYNSQTSADDELAEFKLENIKAGDVIKLKARCNKMGSKSETLTVE